MNAVIYWFFAAAALLTGVTYTISMFVFFRPRPGSTKLRVGLLLSVAIGMGVLAVGISERDSLGLLEGIIGCILMAASHGIYWWAVRAHGQGRPSGAFAVEAPSELVQSGPYRHIRHPFYVAYLLGFSAGAVIAGVWWAWAVPVWMAFAYWTAARHEERVIRASPLGDAYLRYSQQVRGFVPRFRRPGHGDADQATTR